MNKMASSWFKLKIILQVPSLPIEMKKGYVTFHHPLLVHGSFENRSAIQRRAFVINVFADGTCSDSDEPLLEGVPPIKKGEKMEGCFFPLLFKDKLIY